MDVNLILVERFYKRKVILVISYNFMIGKFFDFFYKIVIKKFNNI